MTYEHGTTKVSKCAWYRRMQIAVEFGHGDVEIQIDSVYVIHSVFINRYTDIISQCIYMNTFERLIESSGFTFISIVTLGKSYFLLVAYFSWFIVNTANCVAIPEQYVRPRSSSDWGLASPRPSSSPTLARQKDRSSRRRPAAVPPRHPRVPRPHRNGCRNLHGLPSDVRSSTDQAPLRQ